jgi:hypothetical protein
VGRVVRTGLVRSPEGFWLPTRARDFYRISAVTPSTFALPPRPANGSRVSENRISAKFISLHTAVFIIIEPVDGAGAGRLLVGVLPVHLYRLRRTNMLAAHDRINIYDTRCRCGGLQLWHQTSVSITRWGKREKGEASPMPYYMVQLSYTKEAVTN